MSNAVISVFKNRAKPDLQGSRRGMEEFGHLVWLITRRSRVQIPFPLQSWGSYAYTAMAFFSKQKPGSDASPL